MVITIFYLLLFLKSPYLSLSFEPLNPEVVALISIKTALTDPHGVLNNWDEDSVDPCSWAMITCSPQNQVIGLGAPSQNLSGTLSPRIGNLTNLQQVLLQNNNISGTIPVELGKLEKLQTLDLSNNQLTGLVPETLGQLGDLQYLRLNNNSLSGVFPVSLAKSPHLTFLDLSYNNLTGPVPRFPARTFNIVGNPLMCGTGSAQDCSGTTVDSLSYSPDSYQRKSKNHRLTIALGTTIACTSVLVLALCILLRWKKKHNRQTILDINDQHEEEIGLGNLKRFSLRELQIATGNFSSKNILGKGGFGNVYKGYLQDGSVVAVKRLKDGSASGGNVQFQTELEMISLAVHRNLLRLLGFCATSTERLLVYPFMSNGSVASRLRGDMRLGQSSVSDYLLIFSG